MAQPEVSPGGGLPAFPVVDPVAVEAAQRLLKFLHVDQRATKDTLPQVLTDAGIAANQIVLLHRLLMEHARVVIPLLRSKKRPKESKN